MLANLGQLVSGDGMLARYAMEQRGLSCEFSVLADAATATLVELGLQAGELCPAVVMPTSPAAAGGLLVAPTPLCAEWLQRREPQTTLAPTAATAAPTETTGGNRTAAEGGEEGALFMVNGDGTITGGDGGGGGGSNGGGVNDWVWLIIAASLAVVALGLLAMHKTVSAQAGPRSDSRQELVKPDPAADHRRAMLGAVPMAGGSDVDVACTDAFPALLSKLPGTTSSGNLARLPSDAGTVPPCPFASPAVLTAPPEISLLS